MDQDIISDDSDEDLELMANLVARIRNPRLVRPRSNNFNRWNDAEFFVRFRISKNTAQQILQNIHPQISTKTGKNHAVSPMDRLLLTLRFYASGSMLVGVGDFAGIHKSTAGAIIHQVTRAIAGLRPQHVRFPTTEVERRETIKGFYKVASFPQVLGSIDCTHIRIQSPGGNNAELYRNRKGWFSLNVQTICDSNLRMLDVIARWPGSTHDRTIFANSAVKARLEVGALGAGHLLGDSGYTLAPYMMTPIRNPALPEQALYNESQIRTRNTVERSYGVWKRRFPILSLGMRVSIAHAQNIVVATAVLHNIACDAREGEPPQDPEVQLNIIEIDDDVAPANDDNNVQGNAKQRALVNYFRGRL